jgi:LysR family hydrogen peroxide-inducible transcriptional activator
MVRLAPHNVSLRQLQYAVAVADQLSFRRAAEACGVSQPSLSAQIALLEGELGAPLFERTPRRVLVTQAGRELVERARRILVEVEDLLASGQRASDPLDGTLRIGTISTISPYLLPSITPALRASYPRATLLWTEDRSDAIARGLVAGSLDAALGVLEVPIPTETDHELIAVDRFVLAVPRGHPLGDRDGPADPAELHGHHVLLLEEGHCFREQALAFCTRARAAELEFRATSLPTLVQIVAAGTGITLLPAMAIPVEIHRARLVVRAFREPSPKRTVALLWRKRSPLASALRRLAATIRAAYPAAAQLPEGAQLTRRHRRATRARARR